MRYCQVQTECLLCAGIFLVQPHRIGRVKFCSRKCKDASLKGKVFGNSARPSELRATRRGVKASPETIQKLRESHLGKTGELSSRWKGGISSDKEHLRELWKRNYIKNYARRIAQNAQRRALKLNAEGSHSIEQWEAMKVENNFSCFFCKKKEPEIVLTRDHIIPLSKGGSDFIENIQPLCRSCNSSKSDKIK